MAQPKQDFSAGTILMAIIGCLFTISQIIVFIFTLIQLWYIKDQQDDNAEVSSKNSSQQQSKQSPAPTTETNTISQQSDNKTLHAMQTSIDSNTNSVNTQKRIQKSKKKKPIHIFFRVSTSIASFWFTVCAISSSLDNLYYSMPFIPESYPENSKNVGLSAALTSYLGRITMSVVFIGRLHFIFKASAMAYPGWVIIILIILTIISFILFAMVPIGFLVLDFYTYGDETVQTFILSNVFDIAFSLLLVYLFLYKLFKVLGLQNDSDTNSTFIRNIMKIMTKYCVLVTWALGSTSLSIIYASIAFQSDAELAVYNGYEFVLTVDSFINGFCLYLNYPFGHKLYYRVCKYFDGCCRKICIKVSSHH